MISRIIEGNVSIISRSRRLKPTMLTDTLLVVEIIKSQVQYFLLHIDMSRKYSAVLKDLIPQ